MHEMVARSGTGDRTLTVAIGIASAGRRDILTDTIRHLAGQNRQADAIFVCPALPEHFDRDAVAPTGLPVIEVYGEPGLPAQRNTIIRACTSDILIFLDDDFLLKPDFVEQTIRLFETHPDVVVATGEVIADGIIGPGFDMEEGLRALESAPAAPASDGIAEVFNAYGCNMVLRLKPVRENGLRFDESLPLYAWLEDVDFSRQLAPFGRIVRAAALRGVHLGTKRSGRTPGRKLGYSQIANRVYLARKGNLPWPMALHGMARNIGANLLHWFRPEPWVDRKGRLAGNLMALRDWLKGDIEPARILRID